MSPTDPSTAPLRAAATRLAEQHPLRFVWDHAPVGMALTTVDGLIVEVNPSFCTMLRLSRAAAIGMRWSDLTHPEDLDRGRIADTRLLAGEIDHFVLDRRFLRGDGGVVHCQLKVTAVRDEDGRDDGGDGCRREAGGVVGVLAVAHDVTAHVEARDQLAHAAHFDPLTGLRNRSGFVEAVRAALASKPADAAVVLVDLDRFRAVNDSIGHGTGDRLLTLAADRLAEQTREDEVTARYGDDEFTILTTGPGAPSRAHALAAACQRALRGPLRVGGQEIYCTASVGIATLGAGGSRDEAAAQALIRDADIALYRAKEEGRGRIVEFDAPMRAAVREAMALRTDLHGAAARGELRLQYQPIVDLLDARAVGFEALLRWQHPTRGRIAPDRFISLAEEAGLSPELGRWSLMAACTAMARISRRDDGPYVSVNLSMRQLADPELIEAVDEALLQSRLPAHRLRVEVTEAVVAEDLALVVPALDAMRARGVGIYVDDFGTGVSSYARLHRLPIDALKVDRGFVSGMTRDEDGRSLVYSIITLARSLGLGAIAEGVETAEQRQALVDIGCRHAQGFLFGRPLELEEARAFPMR